METPSLDWIENHYQFHHFQLLVKRTDQIIRAHPANPKVYLILGISHGKLGNYDQALKFLYQADLLSPNSLDIFNAIATVYLDFHHYSQALSTLKKAVSLFPANIQVLHNLSITALKLADISLAKTTLLKLLALDPKNPMAQRNLTLLNQNPSISNPSPNHVSTKPNSSHYHQLRQIEKQYRLLIKNFDSNPHQLEYSSTLIHSLRQHCFFDLDHKLVTNYLNTPQAHEYISPFVSLTLTDNSAIIRRSALAKYHQNLHQIRHLPRLKLKPFTTSQLELGYVSADYGEHATSQLLGKIFSYHSRRVFKVTAFSLAKPTTSPQLDLIKSSVNQLSILDPHDYQTGARSILSAQTDILIDLKGYTKGAQPLIFTQRPAPISVGWLGYPGTISKSLDYLITDPIVTPPQDRHYYLEKLCLLPHTYQANGTNYKPKPDFSALPKYHNHPAQVVITNFNASYKFDLEQFKIWIAILKQTPKSVLWMLAHTPFMVTNLKNLAKKYHLNPKRLIFSKRLPKDLHLNRLAAAHLSLDSFLVNGHTTTSDSLLAGVPIITLLGTHFASRVSASLLLAIGLSELITHTRSDFLKLSLTLTNNSSKLNRIKEKLLNHKKTYPLFNPKRLAGNLDISYLTFYNYHLQTIKPKFIIIKDPYPLSSTAIPL